MMSETAGKEIQELISAARRLFEEAAWWNSKLPADAIRKAYIDSVLKDVETKAPRLPDGENTARKIIERLKHLGQCAPNHVGYRFGYRPPSNGKIVWVDVETEKDIECARAEARGMERVAALLDEGYREVGMSPLIRWLPIEEPAAASRKP